ncbi:uncharacterized protein LOC142107193 [Mixophyes fleayi]|uniref:uncharacterized protein LOC142107193 n=1 Tax=Mixophyes fleayi TaxID=3061075 RepID=UPI003F4DED63
MTVCAMFGCKNRMHKGCGKHFFRFPIKDPERLAKWVEAVQRDDWRPTIHSKVCSDHFTEKDYMIRPGAACPYLRMDAVPTPLYPVQRKRKTKKRKYVKKSASEPPAFNETEVKVEYQGEENPSESCVNEEAMEVQGVREAETQTQVAEVQGGKQEEEEQGRKQGEKEQGGGLGVVVHREVAPRQNQEEVMQSENQGAVAPSENQGAVAPSENQGEVAPSENQGEVAPSENQGAVAPSENQGEVAPSENQGEVAPSKNQGAVAPSKNQGAVAPSENQGAVAPSENQGAVAPSENQGAVAPSENQGAVAPSEKQGEIAPSEKQGEEVSSEKQGVVAPSDKQGEVVQSEKQVAEMLVDVEDTQCRKNMAGVENMSSPPSEQVEYIPVDHAYSAVTSDKENDTPAQPGNPKIVKLRKKIKTLQKQVLRQGVKIKSLKQMLVDLRRNNLVEKDPERVISEYCSGLALALFTNQLKNGHKRYNAIQYCGLMKEFALNLYCASPKAYKFCRLFLCLPHPVSLRHWKTASEGTPELLQEGTLQGETLQDGPLQEEPLMEESLQEVSLQE